VNQSTVIVVAFIAGFVLYLSAKGSIGAYFGFLGI
jgi:hypothetical protein